DAVRGGRYVLGFAFVSFAINVGNSESADIFRRPLRCISGPALRRVRQNGQQFLIIDGVGHENRLVLGMQPRRGECERQRKNQFGGYAQPMSSAWEKSGDGFWSAATCRRFFFRRNMSPRFKARTCPRTPKTSSSHSAHV